MSPALNAQAQQSSLLPDDLPDPVALATAAALPGRDGHFNELLGQMNGAGGQTLAPLWRQFFSATGAAGWQDLAGRQQRIQRRVQEDGASYNVYDQGAQTARVWPLELLPMLIGAEEWQGIARGVIQRARLLNETLADVYGPRRLLDAGLLPASLDALLAPGQVLPAGSAGGAGELSAAAAPGSARPHRSSGPAVH